MAERLTPRSNSGWRKNDMVAINVKEKAYREKEWMIISGV